MREAAVHGWDDACQSAANLIRERSRRDDLLSGGELMEEMKGRSPLLPLIDPAGEEWPFFLKRLVDENEDLRAIHREEETYYYSAQILSETYARLLLGKKAGPLSLIVEVVRENSARYSRPTALHALTEPPFELNLEQILASLQQLADRAEYQDIAQTKSSTGTLFLFSSSHLSSDQASLLAEWIDVGQFNNT